MSRIKSKNTKPEQILRRALWSEGLRYRLHCKTPVGKPDFVFLREKVAVFVDGCQWHGCPTHYVRPRSNNKFWADKLLENVNRDQKQTTQLEAQEWTVVRIWEHEVFVDLEEVVERVAACVRGGKAVTESSWRVFRVEPLNDDGSFERRHFQLLRDSAIRKSIDTKRSTRKWKRN